MHLEQRPWPAAGGCPSALLVDALGTLLELQPPAPLLRGELQRRFGVSIGETDAQRAIGAEIAFYRRHLDEGRDEASLSALRRACARELRAALPDATRGPLQDEKALVDALLSSLRFRAYPDALPALRGYRQRGMRIVVVSNWDVSLHAVLGDVGLDALLDAIVTSAEVGVRKPAPAIFEQALRLAGVPAGEAVHLGDNLEEDVAGARAAGIEAVLVKRDGRPGPPDVRMIPSLAHPIC